MSDHVSPIAALLELAPDFFDDLTEAERAVIPYMFDLWLRPEQIVPTGPWRYCGYICGRGWGKSFAIAVEINRRVQAGEAVDLALMAPNEDRCDELQIQFLIDTSPPWFKAVRYNGGVLWPNGVQAIVYTPEAPGGPRGGNHDVAWLCEIVAWPASTRKEAFNNITTATRRGTRPQVFWDTTSKGSNDVIKSLLELNAEDPITYPIQRGAMFDNPMLTAAYLRAECKKYVPGSQQYGEEVEGKTYGESAGALWKQEWLDRNRRHVAPLDPELRLIAVDPAHSAKPEADESGIIVASRGRDRHSYLEEDLSGHFTPDQWGDLVVRQCVARRCAGVVIERTGLGDHAASTISAACKTHSIVMRLLPTDGPFPSYTPGVIYVREVHAARSKGSRAGGPATETEAGRVHVVGVLASLESELTTYEPGTAQSPNRFDAAVYAVLELAELNGDTPRAPGGDMAAGLAAHAALVQAQRLAPSRRVI